MTSYLNLPSSSLGLIDEREDQKRLLLCSQSSQMPSVSYPIMFDPRENYFMEQQLAEAKDQEQVSIDGSVDHPFNLSSSFSFMDEDHTNISPGETNTSVYDHRSSEQSKWMSSKMRLMKKMMNSNEDIGSNTMWVTVNSENQNQLQSSETENTNNPTNNGIRVCSDCNTTKTPLWRSGPQGPKSLCNACGIRQRKVRRAMIAANGGNPTVNTLMKTGTKWNHKMRKSDTSIATTPLKKRYKLQPDQAQDQHHFQDPTSNVSKNAAFHKAFPQEEKEAAILLMALSCGLVHG